MSQTRKRVLSCEGDGQCSNKGRSVASSRPLRPAKRKRVEDGSGCNANSSTDNQTKASQIGGGGGGGGGGGTRVKRQVWTATAIEAFSEGLLQHGKNFHRILKFMQTKYRKKNDPVIPNLNKDQVRFYYYRTWHKVSALLSDPTLSSATDTKKSKLSKSPSGSDAVKEKNSEACGKPVLNRQSLGAIAEKAEREEGIVTTCKLGAPDKMTSLPNGNEDDCKKDKPKEEDCTANGQQECHEIVEPDLVEDVLDCSPSHNPKLDPPFESSSRLSPPQQYVPLSPADQSSGGMAGCDGGGGEERSGGAVMSEEEEGALDSSMEELPLSPPPPPLALITTTDTEVSDVEKVKENSCLNEKVVSRRDSGRGDTVVVNGVRHSLDLVALIAYFKLKKKCQADHNFPRRLSELVYLGFTTIPGRTKGKRKVQIKLSNCRALQPSDKLAPRPVQTVGSGGGEVGGGREGRASECPAVNANPMAEVEMCPSASHPVTPPTLTMELRPLTSSSWRYVQSLSQNPRLRMTLRSSMTLGQLLAFLHTRWKLGEVGVDGGEEKKDDSNKQLKLYHTHSRCRNLNCKQSSHLHCTALENSVTRDTTPPTTASTLHGSISQGTEPLVGASQEMLPQQDSTAATSDASNCTSTYTCSQECKKKQSTCMSTPQTQPERSGLCTPVTTPPATAPQTTSGDVPENRDASVKGNAEFNCNEVDTVTSKCESQEPSEGDGGTSVCLDLQRGEFHRADGDKSPVDGALKGCIHELDYNPQCVLSSIHHELQCPEKLHFLYEVLLNHDSRSMESLRVLLKIARALGHGTSPSAPSTQSPPPPSSPLCNTSPAIADYMRSLPRRSPWKSPLSKYQRLKKRSPHKHVSPKKLNFSLHHKSKAKSQICSEDPLIFVSANPSPSASQATTQHPSSSYVHPFTSPSSSLLSQALTTVSLPHTPSLPVSTSPTPSLTSTSLTPSPSPIPTTSLSRPSPSPTMAYLKETLKNTTTSTTSISSNTSTRSIQPPVNLVTVPKASIGQFNSLNLQSLFSVATNTLDSGHTSKGSVGESMGGMRRLRVSFGSSKLTGSGSSHLISKPCGSTATPSHSSLLSKPSSVTSSGVVSTRGSVNLHVSTTDSSRPKAVNVQVVSTIQPRSSILPLSMTQPQQNKHTVQSASSTPQPQEPSMHAAVTSSQLQAQVVTTSQTVTTSPTPSSLHSFLHTATTTTAISQTAQMGISDRTLAIINSMKRSKRSKMHQQKAVQARQIVPRPLPFGLPTQAPSLPPTQSPSPLSAQPPPLPIPSTTALQQGGSAASKQTSATHNPSVQRQLITLLQTLVIQHQQKQQQQKMNKDQQQEPPQDLSSAITKKAEEILQMQSSLHQKTTQPPNTFSVPSTDTPTTTTISTTVGTKDAVLSSDVVLSTPAIQPDISEGDVQAAILDNLFVEHTTGAGTLTNSTRLFHTSSDTVDQLLRGLNTRSQKESIQKLSQETASVLPTFARVLESSVKFQQPSSGLLTTSSSATMNDNSNEVGNKEVKDGEGEEEGSGDLGKDERELTPASMSDDGGSGSNDHSNLSLSEVLAGAGAEDSVFQQLAQSKDLLDGLEFPIDTLSQLPATPPRHRDGTTANLPPSSAESDVSIGSLLDFLVTPEKEQNRAASPSGFPLSHVDPTYRSLLEETSVDYIQKFRELASQMNNEQ